MSTLVSVESDAPEAPTTTALQDALTLLLRTQRGEVDRARARQLAAVATAREAGWTWARIAAVLDVKPDRLRKALTTYGAPE